MVASYPTQYEKENNFSQWKVQFENEFNKFYAILVREFKDSEQHKPLLETLRGSFNTLAQTLDKAKDKEKIECDDLNQKISVFEGSLNEIDKLIKEKMCATPLKQALEQLKSIFCDIVNYLIGAGFPSMTVEGVHLSSTQPSDYIKPFKPFSERAQTSRFFLDRLQEELPGLQQTGPSCQP